MHFEKFCSGCNLEKAFIISSKALLANEKCNLIDSFKVNVTHFGDRIKFTFQPPVYPVMLRLMPNQPNDPTELMLKSIIITVCGMVITFVLHKFNVNMTFPKFL